MCRREYVNQIKDDSNVDVIGVHITQISHRLLSPVELVTSVTASTTVARLFHLRRPSVRFQAVEKSLTDGVDRTEGGAVRERPDEVSSFLYTGAEQRVQGHRTCNDSTRR